MSVNLTLGSGLTIGKGITFGAGTGGASFTLSPSDFTNAGNGAGITTNTPTGFTNNGSNGPGENYYSVCLGALNGAPSPTKLNELIAFWAANGLLSDGSASYIFTVTWDPGSSPQSDKVVLALYSDPNYANLNIGTVSTATNDWQTGGQDIYNNGVLFSAQGTYNFPATFTLYRPLITNDSNWC